MWVLMLFLRPRGRRGFRRVGAERYSRSSLYQRWAVYPRPFRSWRPRLLGWVLARFPLSSAAAPELVLARVDPISADLIDRAGPPWRRTPDT